LIFAFICIRRTTQEWSSFWELKSYPDTAEQKKSYGRTPAAGHAEQAVVDRVVRI
jgi:hypothetical protein